METSGLLVEQATLKVVWRFVTMILGAQCVMTIGEQLMQTWYVDNLDLVDQVNTLNVTILIRLLVGTGLRQEIPQMSTFSQVYANKLVYLHVHQKHSSFVFPEKSFHILLL